MSFFERVRLCALRVASPAVVTVCQRQINGFSSVFFVIVDISKVWQF